MQHCKTNEHGCLRLYSHNSITEELSESAQPVDYLSYMLITQRQHTHASRQYYIQGLQMEDKFLC